LSNDTTICKLNGDIFNETMIF